MDYGKAFGFVFEDKNWVSKIAIGGLLNLLSIFIFPVFFVLGYMVEVTQRAMKGDMTLPEWDNWGDKFRKGFALSISFLVYILPAFLLIGIPVILTVIVASASGNANGSDAATAFVTIIFFAFYALYFLYILFLYFLIPAIVVQYARAESIAQALSVRKVFSIVKNNFVDILILVAFMFLAGFIAQIGFIAFIIGAFFTIFYAQLILHNLYGQFGKKIQRSLES